MTRLRVLSLSTLYPSVMRPAFGKFVDYQMQAIARRGDVDLTVINPIGIPPWPLALRQPYRSYARTPPQSERGGVTVLHPRFRLLPVIGSDSNPARIVRAVMPLIRRLHAQQPFDLIDAQFFFPDGPAAAAIASQLALPWTIKARGSDIHMWGARPAARRQLLQAADAAAGMFAVSAALKADMIALRMAGDKIAVHYTGLDRDRFKPTPRSAARTAVTELGIPDDGPLLVVPGALIAIKGQALAIDALHDLPGVRLALAGTGPDRDALQQHALRSGLANRVHLLGQVDHQTLPQLLSAADVVVLPSEREGMANAWIEALACGTPLVIPAIGGAREVVNDPSAGRIAPRAAADIAAAVRELIADPIPQSSVAANAERFSWDASAAELVGHWRRLAGR